MRPGPILAAAVLALALVAGAASAAAQDCPAPTTVSDKDDRLAAMGKVCASEVNFSENGVTWRIHTFDTRRRGPLFVVLHDDEDAAFETAAYGLSRYGGVATVVETGGRRMNGRIDPNRNFHAGRLSCRGPEAAMFTRAMLAPRRARPIIALHSNARGASATGGAGSISIRAPYRGAAAFPSAKASGGRASEDAMVILAHRRGAQDRGTRRLKDRLNAEGVHVMVETVDPPRTDCSLSHYAVANGLPYANVEVVDGDAATQREILDILMRVM